jgi:hypothetical protein
MRSRPVKVPEIQAQTDESTRIREEEYERLKCVTAQMGTMNARVEALPPDDDKASRLSLGRRARASDDMRAQARLAAQDAVALTSSLLRAVALYGKFFGTFVGEWGGPALRMFRKKVQSNELGSDLHS